VCTNLFFGGFVGTIGFFSRKMSGPLPDERKNAEFELRYVWSIVHCFASTVTVCVLQCVAVRCSTLQCVAVRCSSVLQCANSSDVMSDLVCIASCRHQLHVYVCECVFCERKQVRERERTHTHTNTREHANTSTSVSRQTCGQTHTLPCVP